MFDCGTSGGGYETWTWTAKASTSRAREAPRPRWQIVHGELLGVAKRRAQLDAEEARWIREAEAVQIWKPFGMVSMLDYLERVLGYAPKTGHHRLRVARALGDLPALSDALAQGELAFSAVKELVRVAAPSTVDAWIDAARGKNVRQIEELCAGHKPGDRPEDPAEPDARLQTVTLEDVDGATYALYRQARLHLEEQHGSRLPDADLLRAMATAALAPPTDGEHVGRATYAIALTVCRVCDRATQDGAGVSVPVTPAALAQARCFAQHIGDLDAKVPQRATQDIPPATVRSVWRRARGRCETPGCRSAHALEIHHIIARCDGGTHDLSNLSLRCSSCHRAHHEGRLVITGTAPDKMVTTRVVPLRGVSPPIRDEHDHTTSPRYAATVARIEAMSAIRNLGWPPAVAKAAVDAACADLGEAATTEEVVRAAIKRTPRPSN
jgi:hypothetical protein